MIKLTQSQKEKISEYLTERMFELYEYSKIREHPIIHPKAIKNFWVDIKQILRTTDYDIVLNGTVFETPLLKISFFKSKVFNSYIEDISGAKFTVVEIEERP